MVGSDEYTCEPRWDRATEEICDNEQDDDCDGDGEPNACEDADCDGWRAEDCTTDADEDCSDGGGTDSCGTGACEGFPEICDNDHDEDCDGLADDDDPTECDPNNPSPVPEPAQEDCEQCGACDGAPVSLRARQMYVGPHEDVRIASPQGGSFDLRFFRIFDSVRAHTDHADDLTSSTEQTPYVRVLGPGWRHNFDVRLILEGNADFATEGAEPDPENPLSVSLETIDDVTQLKYIGPGVYGRVADDGITAQHVGDRWIVRTESGDVLEFPEPSAGASTELHPFGEANPGFPAETSERYFLRLQFIRPLGNDKYRIHLWHEEETAAPPSGTTVPPGACNEIVRLETTCSSARGLLAAVSVEWLDGTIWRRGSSIELKYIARVATAFRRKNSWSLDRVLEGADRDEGSTSPTHLAAFRYLPVSGTLAPTLVNAGTCAGRVDATGADTSGTACVDRTNANVPNLRWQYNQFTATSGVALDYLIGEVVKPVNRDNQIVLVPEEQFHWEDDGTAPPGWPLPSLPRVIYHLSPRVELVAPAGPEKPNGTMTWLRNDVENAVTFARGVPVMCSAGTCGHPTKTRELAYSSTDSRKALGVLRQHDKNGRTVTLRAYELPKTGYHAGGALLYEAEVVSAGNPTMSIDDKSTDEQVTFSADVTQLRRVTRHYYSKDGTGAVPRLVASATTSPFAMPAGMTARFPGESAVPTSWRGAQSAATRALPVDLVKIATVDHYFDVDIFDADDDADGNLNESEERQVVWTHHVRSSADVSTTGLKGKHTSERTILDVYGRIIERLSYFDYGNPVTARTLVGKSTTTYLPVGASTAARNRGRMSAQSRFTDLTLTTPASLVDIEACGAGAYDEWGELVCFVRPQSPSGLTTTKVTTVGPSGGARTTKTTQRVGATILAESFERWLPSGFVVERGAGAMSTQYFAPDASTAAVATSATQVATQKLVVSSPTVRVLSSAVTTFDAFGFPNVLEEFEGDRVTLKRRTVYLPGANDDERRPQQTRMFHGTASNAFYTSHAPLDAITDQPTGRTELDGDVYVNEYGTSGSSAGRVINVRRNSATGATVTSFTHTLEGQIASVKNGTESAASYTYAQDSHLLKETIHGARDVRREFDQVPAVTSTHPTLGKVGLPLRRERMRSTTAADFYNLETLYDNVGRPLYIKDTINNVFVVRWVYDSKGGYVNTAGWQVEGDGPPTGSPRTFAITDKNTQGRLAYVTHPGGTTFFEYDALGRVIGEARFESTLPTTLTNADTLAHMKVTETTYAPVTGEVTAIRYPSGRSVTFTYGADKRAPNSVVVFMSSTGIGSGLTLASAVQRDIDGAILSWVWGSSTGTSGPLSSHSVTRDMLGRITEVRDTAGAVNIAARLTTTYDPDGDPTSYVDHSPAGTHRSILASSTAIAPQAQTFDYTDANHPDALTEWNMDGTSHELTLHPSGRRDEHFTTPSSVTYPYSYGHLDGAEMITLRDASGAGALDINVDYDTNGGVALPAFGTMRRIDYGNTGVFEVEHITYAGRGDVDTTDTNSTAGIITHRRDEQMRRWQKLNGLAVTTNYRWNGSQLLDMYQQKPISLGGGFNRDEYIYLAGMPIGAVHTDDANTTPVLSYLSPDARGIPRRVLSSSSSTLQQTRRLVMDAWGKGSLLVDVAGAGPDLPFRFPGQIADETGLSENNWRMYLPDLGVYLSPDPAHRIGAQMDPGPQAYAYASSRPLVNADPTGLGRFTNWMDAAANASWAILVHNQQFSIRREMCTTIFEEKCGGSCEYDFTAFNIGPIVLPGATANCSVPRNVPAGTKAIAFVHNHVDVGDIYPSGPDWGIPRQFTPPLQYIAVFAPPGIIPFGGDLYFYRATGGQVGSRFVSSPRRRRRTRTVRSRRLRASRLAALPLSLFAAGCSTALVQPDDRAWAVRESQTCGPLDLDAFVSVDQPTETEVFCANRSTVSIAVGRVRDEVIVAKFDHKCARAATDLVEIGENRPRGSPRFVKIHGGWLVGFNDGERGGRLLSVSDDGTILKTIYEGDPVTGIITNGKESIFSTGMLHGATDRGALYYVDLDENKIAHTETLTGAVLGIDTDDRGHTYLVTTRGVYRAGKPSQELVEVLAADFQSLFPRSIVVDNDRLLIGLQHYLLEVRIERDTFRPIWRALSKASPCLS